MTWKINPDEVRRRSKKAIRSEHPHLDFQKELSELGYYTGGNIEIGKLVRLPAPNEKGNKESGWYVYHEVVDEDVRIGVGIYGDWRNGETIKWVSQSEGSLTYEQRRNVEKNLADARAKQEADKAQRQRDAAEDACKLYDAAKTADTHPYLEKKEVKYPIARVDTQGRLVLPMYDEHNEIVNAQTITPTGQKRYQFGGKKQGTFLPIEGDERDIYIVEGFATGLSVHEATGSKVYVAWDTGNLSPMAYLVKRWHPDSTIIYASDNDENGAGQRYAESAASAIGAELIICPIPTDFNDMAKQQGVKAVRDFLTKRNNEPPKPDKKKKAAPKDKEKMPDDIRTVPGSLGDVVSYYNQTAQYPNDMFAVQSALALGSFLLGRWFITCSDNMTPLYFLNIGGSGSGKEQPFNVIRRCLDSVEQGNLITERYTSRGGIYTALELRPRHITFIDEFGDYMEAISAGKNGLYAEANALLKSAFTTNTTYMVPQSYSQKSVPKAQREKPERIYNPSITLLAASTPDKLYDNINKKLVEDGFMNRFIITLFETDKKFRKRRKTVRSEVPYTFTTWVSAIQARKNFQEDMAHDPPGLIEIPFTQPALQLISDFEDEIIEHCEVLEVKNPSMVDMFKRTQEIAMKLSLIIALSRDPTTKEIHDIDVDWAVKYTRYHAWRAAKEMSRRLSSTPFERQRKDCFLKLRELQQIATDGWVSETSLRKCEPLCGMKPREIREVLDTMVEMGYVELDKRIESESGRGRPAYYYREAEEKKK